MAEEVVVTTSADAAVALTLVDAEQPWLGLDSFSEETRQYFHGREEEIAELARRVQRKTLTVLFGQSGLGKTSILRAGIVPRLRREGYCPVYVRIDYAQGTPRPAEQIKQAIFHATEASGTWGKPGAATQGETLWEFLHHRDDVLRDRDGRPLIPLLIFDQFEEIFTLAQDDDFGRRRAAEFVEDLADLVENRLPKAIEQELEADDTVIERFDFERADYRLLLALREDYLAHLEGFKGAMPSITQNRMRLARMTGTQALAAVTKPGGQLVSQEVAESIVRFVAGGAELRNAEVEPALLSLVCRELNNARIAQGRGEISADVLAGSHESILAEFYERALADQAAGVRRFIEEEMLTESGFRESLAEERVLRAFAAAGAPQGTLAILVNRRLLRIEERLDMRRVELTHDVLCPVVRANRDRRHEREQRDAAERELAAQRQRELSARRALARARKVAMGAGVLAVVAVAGAIFGYMNMQRARDAELRAQQTRAQAESARAEAEKLIVYLLDDFYYELEPVGRLDIVARLSKRATDYYAALPAELRNTESERTRALALVRYGYASRYLNQLGEASSALDQAIAILTDLRAKGDASESAAIGLALASSARARVYDSQGQFELGTPLSTRATDILEPLMQQPQPSSGVRRAFTQAAVYRGFTLLRRGQEEDSIRWLDRARDTARSVDGLQLGDLPSAVGFAEATSWKVTALNDLGRPDEARATAEEGRRIASAVLEKRPNHMGALRAHALLTSALADIAVRELDPATGLQMGTVARQDWADFLKLDPGNVVAQNNYGVSTGVTMWSLWNLGRGTEALGVLRTGMAKYQPNDQMAQMTASNAAEGAGIGAIWTADYGDAKGSAEFHALQRQFGAIFRKGLPPDSFVGLMPLERRARTEYQSADGLGDYTGMLSRARASIDRLGKIPVTADGQRREVNQLTSFAYLAAALAQWHLRDYAGAESSAREAMRFRALVPLRNTDDELYAADPPVILAAALARQGRLEEARAAIAPALATHRRYSAKGPGDMTERASLAGTIYVAALANPPQAAGLLAEAQRLMQSLPPDMLRRRTVAVWRDWIAEERAKTRQ